MKKVVAASSALVFAGTLTAFAGGLAEPTMEPEVIEAATSSASHDFLVPLFLLLFILAAATSGP